MKGIKITSRKYINIGNVYSLEPHVAKWWLRKKKDMLINHVFGFEDDRHIPPKYRLPTCSEEGDQLHSFGFCWSTSIRFTVTDHKGTVLDDFTLGDVKVNQQQLHYIKRNQGKTLMYVMDERKGSLEIDIPITGKYRREDLTFHATHFYVDWGICDGIQHVQFEKVFQWEEVAWTSFSQQVWIK